MQGLIVSLDWHQVLDTIRTKYKAIRTEDWQWNYLLNPVKYHLSEIRRLAESKGESVKIIVLSISFIIIHILRHIATRCSIRVKLHRPCSDHAAAHGPWRKGVEAQADLQCFIKNLARGRQHFDLQRDRERSRETNPCCWD